MNSDIEFVPNSRAALAPKLVLSIPGSQAKNGKSKEARRFLRVTHVFANCVFAMWVSSPQAARSARRPHRMAKDSVEELIRSPGVLKGSIAAPAVYMRPLDESQERKRDVLHGHVKPLVEAFGYQKNLSKRFNQLINEHAARLSMSATTLRRLVLRFYYFGELAESLLELPRGPAPGAPAYQDTAQVRRRGAKASVEEVLGKKTFIVRPVDVLDMVKAVERALREGPTNLRHVYEYEYLKKDFKKRHPATYARYLRGEISAPVSPWQFWDYISKNKYRITQDLLQNLRGHRKTKRPTSTHHASGPGAIYEVDATGARVHLAIGHGARRVLIRRPWIYLVIDRWSRYIVGVHVTTRNPSIHELRQALLVSVTSRDRFRRLGIITDDKLWPPGLPPAVLCSDRGGEFRHKVLRKELVGRMRVPHRILKAMCPDAKATIERMIGVLKERLSLKLAGRGGYAQRPNRSPRASRKFKQASKEAACTLIELYRVLIEVVHDHNTRPHKALQNKLELTAAGVAPIPRDAYMWGLENITGLDVAPFSSDAEAQLHWQIDTVADAQDGLLFYRNRPYDPVNAAAKALARSWKKRHSDIPIRCDPGDPMEVRHWAGHSWAVFKMTHGAVAALGHFTLEEEELLKPQAAHNARVADEEAQRQRQLAPDLLPPKSKTPALRVPDRQERELSRRVADDVNSKLWGTDAQTRTEPKRPAKAKTRVELIEDEELEQDMRSLMERSQ